MNDNLLLEIKFCLGSYMSKNMNANPSDVSDDREVEQGLQHHIYILYVHRTRLNSFFVGLLELAYAENSFSSFREDGKYLANIRNNPVYLVNKLLPQVVGVQFVRIFDCLSGYLSFRSL